MQSRSNYEPSFAIDFWLRRAFLATMMLTMSFSSVVSAQQTISHEKAVLTAIHNSTVAASDPGVVQSINAETGADVSSNETIVTLNSDIFEARFRVALEEEQIARLQAQNDVDVEFATKQAEVNNKLLERSADARSRYKKSVMLTELDRVNLELEQSQLSIKQAKLRQQIAEKTETLRARLKDVAELNLKNRKIKTPNEGRVAQVFVQEGEWVTAGQPIARVINLKKLRVKGVFNKDHVFAVKKGDKCEFQFSIGGKTTSLATTVSYVGSEIVDDIFQVWADIDSPDGKLVPGIRGRLTIEIEPTNSITSAKSR